MSTQLTPDGFELVRPNLVAGLQGGVKVHCACGAAHFYPTKNVAQACVTELVFKKFRQLGWDLGKKREDDRCPDCQIRAPKAPKKQWSAKMVRPVPKEEPVMPTTLSSSDRADIDKVLDKVLASKEDPKTARTLLRATIAEQVAIADVMRQHIKAHATLPGVFEYDENWSDARCIEEAKLNRPLSEGSAASVRKSMFGPLVTKTASGPIDHRVAALEATVAELRAQLTELQDHITRGSK